MKIQLWGSTGDYTVMAKEHIAVADRKRCQVHKRLEKRYDAFLESETSDRLGPLGHDKNIITLRLTSSKLKRGSAHWLKAIFPAD